MLTDGQEKVGKYYSCLDKKPSFVLVLGKTLISLVVRHINETFEVLHPYYKLAYIKVSWGGPDKQVAEIEAGNPDAKDWQDEARKVSEFDGHCETLLTANVEEGWAAELCRYLGTMQRDVTKNTDIVEWWQVRIDLPWNLFTHSSSFCRTTQHYILHLHISHSMSSHHKLHRFPVSSCFWAANKLQ